MINLLVATPFESDLILPVVMIAIGLTLIGLFSKYKIYLLMASGPLIFMMFHIGDDTHIGWPVLVASFAAWILFNVYAAFFGGNSNE